MRKSRRDHDLVTARDSHDAAITPQNNGSGHRRIKVTADPFIATISILTFGQVHFTRHDPKPLAIGG